MLKVIKNNKKFIFRTFGFLFLIFFIFILSKFLTEVSFTKNLDINNPDHIFREISEPDINQRQIGFFILLGTFSLISIAVGKWQGFASLQGLFLSVFTIYKLIVPLILNGWPPVPVTFVCGLIVIIGTIFFANGFNSKTIIAVSGSTITLIITLSIGEIFRTLMHVTGYGSSEAYYLLTNSQLDFDMGGIVVASLILSGIGLLDDITITQAAIIHELDAAKPTMKLKELYRTAMNVGKDHAGAVVNSLFWAYAASTLPLLLLANFDGVRIGAFLSNNAFVEEVLRTLVTSSGLVLAIPITTFIGAFLYKNHKTHKFLSRFFDKESGHSHIH